MLVLRAGTPGSPHLPMHRLQVTSDDTDTFHPAQRSKVRPNVGYEIYLIAQAFRRVRAYRRWLLRSSLLVWKLPCPLRKVVFDARPYLVFLFSTTVINRCGTVQHIAYLEHSIINPSGNTIMPLTEEQRRALPELRAQFSGVMTEDVLGSSMPFDKRAHLPTEGIPDDITAHVEIAPPLSTPFPLLDPIALKQPEDVPVFFYSFRNENLVPVAPEDTKVIFYVHGGGNLAFHPTDIHYTTLFSAILRTLAMDAGDSVPCKVIAPCYRLATVPENTFPAALQDILAAYDFVVSQGYKPSNITLAGDSAGGNHGRRSDALPTCRIDSASCAAVVLTHLVLESNRPSPHGVIAISPASIQVYDNLSEHAKAQATNDLLTLSTYQLTATAYIANTGFSPIDPLVSGSFITFTESWPKTLILIGTADQLIDASKELEKRLVALKRPVELVEYDERPHGWWLVKPIFGEEIQDAAQRIARFVLG